VLLSNLADVKSKFLQLPNREDVLDGADSVRREGFARSPCKGRHQDLEKRM
jgi:hypothetical protein